MKLQELNHKATIKVLKSQEKRKQRELLYMFEARK